VNQTAVNDKNFALVATFCFLLGAFGVHQSYYGKIISGVLMVFTIGGLGIWALVDFVIVCFGEFTDSQGIKIKYAGSN
jgi:TM2 domain-containing membrane protein YozV